MDDPTTTDGASVSLTPEEPNEPEPNLAHLREKARALVGKVISERYRIDEIIALGGMGTVFRGTHVLMRKRVAIKILHPGTDDLPELVARFEREAIAGAHIQHPNVASATDFGKLEEGGHFLVIEYVKGRTLHEEISEGAFSVPRAIHIARQIAAALEATHGTGIVHRDVKPRNVMLLHGQYDVAKLIDFGFAKVHRERLSSLEVSRIGRDDAGHITKVGTVFGTIAYLAPEAALGMDSVDTRSDLYALGVIFFEMLTGRRPFEHTDAATLFHMHREAPIPRLEGLSHEPVPAEVEVIVRKLLAKDPTDRYQSAFEVIDAIDAAVSRAGIVLGPALPVAGVQAPRAIAIREGSKSDFPTAAGVPEPKPASSSITRSVPGGGPSTRFLAAGVVLAFGVFVLAIVAVRGRDGQGSARTMPSASAPSRTESVAPATATVNAPAAAPPSSATTSVPATSESASAEPVPELRNALRIAVKARAWTTAEQALLVLVDQDKGAFKDREIVASARETATALARESDDRAAKVFDAFATKLGEDGIDVLYDIVQARGGSPAAARATALLRDESVLERGSPAVRIAFLLRDAPCEKKLDLLDRAVKEGDQRALAVLEQTGIACFKRSKAVADAQRALRARLSP